MTRKLTLAAVTIGLGVAFSCFCAEIVLRVAGIAPVLPYKPNPLYGWSHIPGASFQARAGNFDISINSRGLRDREFEVPKPRDVFRLLVLGDSFTEAFQVPSAATFVKQLETQLQTYSLRRGQVVEVINAGASGYGTDNELLFFRHEGVNYGSNIVVLALYIGNDIRNNWHELEVLDSGGPRKPHFVLRDGVLDLVDFPFEPATGWMARARIFLNTHTKLYPFLRTVRDRLRSRQTEPEAGGLPLDLQLFSTDDLRPWLEAWRVTGAILAELDAEVSRAGARLFVVLIPTQFQVHRKYWEEALSGIESADRETFDLERPNRLMRELLEDRRIAHVDLLEGLRDAAEEGGELYLAEDGHWNAKGHEVAARLIESALLAEAALPSADN